MKTPHLDFITKNGINVTETKGIPAVLKKSLKEWQDGFDEMNKSENENFKKQWTWRLEKRSEEIAAELQKKYNPAKDGKKPAPKAPPVEKPPVEKPPVEKPPVEKPPVEKPPVEEPPAEEEAEDDTTKALNIMNQLWLKNEGGVLKIDEDDLQAAGINMWGLIGFVSGKIGPYIFKSAFFKDTWTITKEKPEA